MKRHPKEVERVTSEKSSKSRLSKHTKVGLVSACLVGVCCRYDGSERSSPLVLNLLKEGFFLLPLCPEQMGGLPTPRARNRLVGGDGGAVLDGRARVVDEGGNDNTKRFVEGAREVLKIAELFGARVAYLKAGSPSCGCDGEEGEGVTAALLRRKGIKVVGVE
ncbi:MAG: DUF523 domain-containing protein [Planctomycetota bacterium]|nr:DUF523 domain-containing protein [Planctomycetota bacterium]